MVRWFCVATTLLLAQAALVVAQEVEQAEKSPTQEPIWYRTGGELTELPASPEQWINCPPLSLESLDGKGIVLYYFEEQCPNCEKRWPALLQAAAQHQDDPVIFIAVNSGNAPQQIAGYLKRNHINWPVIVDTDRSFEKESLGKTISLENIYAVNVRTASGEWRGASPDQLDAVATAAAEGGKWRVDPAAMPDELRAAWAQVEIGNYPAASRAIMRAGKQGDAATKAAAKQLFDAVKASMDGQLAAINQQLGAEEHWAAYQALGQFMQVYDGYPMHPAVAEKYKEVAQMDAVKAQHAAAKKLAAAIRTGSKNTPAAIKRAVGQLERLIEEYPDTEAATKAQELLDQVNQSQPAGEEA